MRSTSGWLLLATCLCAGPSAAALDFDPEQWVLLTIEVKQQTLDGMQDRLELLQAGAALEVLTSSDEVVQDDIARTYARYGTDPVRHRRDGATYAEQIAVYLQENDSLQHFINELDGEFDRLVEALALAKQGQE